MSSEISYTSMSNNNRYTFTIHKNQRLIKKYNDYNSSSSCLGGVTGQFSANLFDRFCVNLYANINRNGNNHIWLPDEDIEFFINYVQEMFPIFSWKIYRSDKQKDMIIELLFKFDTLANVVDCNQMKLILNLVRRVYETPRSYQLKAALELYRQNWHNLDLYQILLLAELTEYYSTNDHKLISNTVSILPTKEEIIKRTTEVTGIFNSNTLKVEGYKEAVKNLPHKFEYYPTTLTPELLEQFEYLFSLTNNYRKKLQLDEL